MNDSAPAVPDRPTGHEAGMIRSVLAVLAGYLTLMIGVSAFFAIVLTLAFRGFRGSSSA